ncbi:glutaredoxin family protein [Nitrosococcus watsonii]|uniref:Glutaredoxin 2 n=1 Tax=Nitrosococcus watsoni (strain C-113) TaxID=105559 RepID=D8KBJ9_NITWC|nr:glutaredoxin family protein [Nitrosococcus watsonii]ADJ29646.1 glutaredoxin 2 [Nitrosococcus watsonii C-113]
MTMTTHSTKRLILYHTAGCHLCEEARRLLAQLPEITAEEVDIGDDPLLAERYGTEIPVLLQPASGLTLKWPFTLETIRQWTPAGQ